MFINILDGEAVKENGETFNQSLHSAGLPVAIEKAVEDGIGEHYHFVSSFAYCSKNYQY